MKIEGLSAAAVIAVGKLVSDTESSKASAGLAAGQHNVDVTIRVKGTLTRGENYTQPIVEKANPWLILAVALSHLNGITVDSIVKEALTADPAMVDSLKVKAAEAIAAIKGPTETACNGKTTAKLTAELVA
jgi:hypothetical protein